MQTLDIEKTVHAWRSLAPAVFVPHSEEEYQRIVSMLDDLIDEVGEDESHPLASLVEVLGALVQNYEDRLQIAELSNFEEANLLRISYSLSPILFFILGGPEWRELPAKQRRNPFTAFTPAYS